MDNQKLTEAVVNLTGEIGDLKRDIGQVQGIVSNGLSSTVESIDQKLDTFLEHRFLSCPYAKMSEIGRQKLNSEINKSRRNWAIGALVAAILIGLPGWVALLEVIPK